MINTACYLIVIFSFLFAIMYLYKRVDELHSEVTKLKIELYRYGKFQHIVNKGNERYDKQ